MKKTLFIMLLGAAMASCSSRGTEPIGHAGTAQTEDAPQQTTSAETLTATKWQLKDFAGENEVYTASEDQEYSLTFNPTDSTFTVETDCNNISGTYAIVGDSLKFDNMLSTMRACPDDRVERGMKQILPMITTYTIVGDSTLLLRSDARIMGTFSKAK